MPRKRGTYRAFDTHELENGRRVPGQVGHDVVVQTTDGKRSDPACSRQQPRQDGQRSPEKNKKIGFAHVQLSGGKKTPSLV